MALFSFFYVGTFQKHLYSKSLVSWLYQTKVPVFWGQIFKTSTYLESFQDFLNHLRFSLTFLYIFCSYFLQNFYTKEDNISDVTLGHRPTWKIRRTDWKKRKCKDEIKNTVYNNVILRPLAPWSIWSTIYWNLFSGKDPEKED